MPPRRHAFTLIELLVVIAIIALLVSILLPSLGKARNLARLTQSIANLKNIASANDTYRSDHKGILPYMVPVNKVPATWSFGGKNCNTYWIGIYDFPGYTRPLNPYVQPEVQFERLFTADNRESVQMPVFRSPGDRATFQRPPYPAPNYTLSSYQDVGTSYHYNGRWYDLVPTTSVDRWSDYSVRLSKAFGRAVDSALVNTATFVMFHDQAADVVTNDPQGRNWTTEFGDRNKSVMAFLDAHVDYVLLTPLAHEGPGYTFRFPRLANILQGVRP